MVNNLIFLCMIGLFISFNLKAFGFGIRVQGSDFIIPIMSAITLNQASFKDTFQTLGMWKIILTFTSILIIGATCHWFYFDTINFWGVKKIIGWCFCVAYFLIGILLHKKQKEVTQTLIVAAWIMGAICLIGCSFSATRDFFIYKDLTRLQGLMGNPNAYGIFFAFIFLLQTIANHTLPYKKQTKTIGLIILGLNLLGTTSRAAWGSFIIAYFIYASKTKNLKKILGIFTLFFVFFFAIMIIIIKSSFFKTHFYTISHYFEALNGIIKTGLVYSMSERIKALLILLPTFLEHPITGIGLGGAMTLHQGQEQYTIHNTALWFLIEMGILGFTAFIWFVHKIINALRTSEDTYIKALTFPMLSFAIASLANELFYQRYFWLFVGMIMCDWVKNSLKKQTTTL